MAYGLQRRRLAAVEVERDPRDASDDGSIITGRQAHDSHVGSKPSPGENKCRSVCLVGLRTTGLRTGEVCGGGRIS